MLSQRDRIKKPFLSLFSAVLLIKMLFLPKASNPSPSFPTALLFIMVLFAVLIVKPSSFPFAVLFITVLFEESSITKPSQPLLLSVLFIIILYWPNCNHMASNVLPDTMLFFIMLFEPILKIPLKLLLCISLFSNDMLLTPSKTIPTAKLVISQFFMILFVVLVPNKLTPILTSLPSKLYPWQFKIESWIPEGNVIASWSSIWKLSLTQ